MSEARSGNNSPQRMDITGMYTGIQACKRNHREPCVTHPEPLLRTTITKDHRDDKEHVVYGETLHNTQEHLLFYLPSMWITMSVLCCFYVDDAAKSNTCKKKFVYRYYWVYWHVFWTWDLWGNHHLHLQFFNLNFFYYMLDLCFLSSLISLKPYPISINWTWFTIQCYYYMLQCNTIHFPYSINRDPWARSLF